MQSAYERAMQRMGGEIREFSPEQKEQLAELDRKADAKIAEIKMRTDSRLLSADPAEEAQLRQDMAIEIRALNEHREREKEVLKEKFGNESAQQKSSG